VKGLSEKNCGTKLALAFVAWFANKLGARILPRFRFYSARFYAPFFRFEFDWLNIVSNKTSEKKLKLLKF